MSCGVGRRHGSDPAWLWLWCRPVATAPIRRLAWEPPYTSGAALEKAKRQKRKKRKEVGTTNREDRDIKQKTKERERKCVFGFIGKGMRLHRHIHMKGRESTLDLSSLPHFKTILDKASVSSASLSSTHKPILQTGKTEAGFCSPVQSPPDPLGPPPSGVRGHFCWNFLAHSKLIGFQVTPNRSQGADQLVKTLCPTQGGQQ